MDQNYINEKENELVELRSELTGLVEKRRKFPYNMDTGENRNIKMDIDNIVKKYKEIKAIVDSYYEFKESIKNEVNSLLRD